MVDDGISLVGMARLMKMAFDGIDLAPIAVKLIARASADEQDAEALMDLSTLLQLQGKREVGLAAQAHALKIKRLYELPARGEAAIRLLAIMAPGDLMTNTPLPFLLEDSDVSLGMLYLLPGEPIPSELPVCDAVFIAVAESDSVRGLHRGLAGSVGSWGRPVLNLPDRIVNTSRTQAYQLLDAAAGVSIPMTTRTPRDALERLSIDGLAIGELLSDGVFPVIVRPVNSHAGRGLARVDAAHDMAAYLQATAGDEFFISRFIDYRGEDGLFRKYRIVLVDSVPYPAHMGVSAHWMIHYLNAGMTDSASKRAEEEAFMRDFAHGFGRRHAEALRTVAERFGLDYLVIDCAETPDGELLVFEVCTGAVVHAMDPPDLFPYKPPHMARIFDAFRAMLARATGALP
ncbi:Glutathione synthase/Ribosomal protein S6 modification enzyme (glutaminyl transferase) [Variovorax sp. SRS16]|uniref:ATP-grasp domain-containing protein n=1 Tax=Variovorax sp. SRS16 TaxID=282217 RepID=UPI001319AFF3|nr:RimK family alpha-L-glutamate ligase [Variovorax sp. SRS16]VTU13233.1 Glutathione synthase/Ribosomal protein S6 modification enzyme (glutaminyl transferase) [Variovorax sp. SRS16]